jgi:hypothetical protein
MTPLSPSLPTPPTHQIWSLVGLPGPEGQAPAANLLPGHTHRVVVINKSERGCNVELRLPKADAHSHAELHWLSNNGGVDSKSGITWRGQTYLGTMDGNLVGDRSILNLAPAGEKDGSNVFVLPVPAGQAVLMVAAS